MPAIAHREGIHCYYQWGSSGAKYYYRCGHKTEREAAKKKAEEQGRAAYASGYKSKK